MAMAVSGDVARAAAATDESELGKTSEKLRNSKFVTDVASKSRTRSGSAQQFMSEPEPPQHEPLSTCISTAEIFAEIVADSGAQAELQGNAVADIPEKQTIKRAASSGCARRNLK
jgi:hypothetical protein